VGNIPLTIHERLTEDKRVSLAVPIAMGDNVGGARIIGTDASFFELSPASDERSSFRLLEGRLFETDFEAVAGARAAREQGLAIGSTFLPAHGVEPGLEDDVHDDPHVVVGILEPSGTAFDDALFTSVATVNAVHGAELHAEAGEDAGEETRGAGAAPAADLEHPEDEEHDEGAVTAILVRPTGFAEANQIWQDFYAGTEAQAVFPGAELGSIFDLLDQAQDLLLGVGWLTALMAALTLFLAVFSAGAARERLLAIMRALGASRTSVSRVVLLEALVIALAGALLGRLMGYAAAAVLASRVAGGSAVPVEIRYLPDLEPWLWFLPLGVGLLAGAIPAWQAYRARILERLTNV
jgi:putative ABC transport system permease protein